jgi:hypothetical protein
MTKTRAIWLIFIGALVFETVGILGLAALGVRGIGLSLGALIPLALAADGVARVVMHYGVDADEQRKR